MEFKDNLKRIMDDKGVSSYRVGKDTGVKKESILSYLNKGVKPEMKNIKILADYFGVSTDTLLKGDEYYEINETEHSIIDGGGGQKSHSINLDDSAETVNEDVIQYQELLKMIKILETEIELYREREKEFKFKLSDAENEIKNKNAVIDTLNKDNKILGKENVILKTQVEMLNKSSRKQSGGSASEKTAKTA